MWGAVIAALLYQFLPALLNNWAPGPAGEPASRRAHGAPRASGGDA